LNDLKKVGKDISELLVQRLKREVTVKSDRLIIPETAKGQRFGVKDVKTQVKRAWHHLGLSDKYRVLAEHRRICIVRVKEKLKPHTERKGSAPHPHNPYHTSSLVTSHPEGLFFTRSIRSIPIRFVLVTLILVAPISILPGLLALVGNSAKNERFFGQLVKATVFSYREFSKPVAWVLRPLQGIPLSMIFAERFLSFLDELSIRASYAGILIRSTLFVMGSALVSLFLSVVWALDNLGVKIYNRKTGMSALALDHHVDSCYKKHYCPDQLHGCNPDKYYIYSSPRSKVRKSGNRCD